MQRDCNIGPSVQDGNLLSLSPDLDDIVDDGGSDGGNREFSAGIGSNDGTYIESVSINMPGLKHQFMMTMKYLDHCILGQI